MKIYDHIYNNFPYLKTLTQFTCNSNRRIQRCQTLQIIKQTVIDLGGPDPRYRGLFNISAMYF